MKCNHPKSHRYFDPERELVVEICDCCGEELYAIDPENPKYKQRIVKKTLKILRKLRGYEI